MDTIQLATYTKSVWTERYGIFRNILTLPLSEVLHISVARLASWDEDSACDIDGILRIGVDPVDGGLATIVSEVRKGLHFLLVDNHIEEGTCQGGDIIPSTLRRLDEALVGMNAPLIMVPIGHPGAQCHDTCRAHSIQALSMLH